MDIVMHSIEMVKIKHGYSREIVTNIFTQDTHESNFWKNRDCRIPSVNILFHSSESISFEIPKNWEIAPEIATEFISLDGFKQGHKSAKYVDKIR